MKVLKVLPLIFAFFLLSMNSILAQSKATQLTDEQKAEMAENMEAFQELLKLSEVQKPQFEAITKKYAGQMMALKDGGGSKYSKYKKVKSISKNRNAEMKKLLSKEQYQLYLEKQKELQKKMKAKQG